ncbi:MAG TPA: DUF1217 domain-containing protein [Hyphomicrobiaceae bacterium]|nr:DUF1217 domain-containing protein [Hyphomicrobiaceae bacterium]
MLSTPIGYKLIASDLTAALKRTSEQPVVQRESEYYLETIKNIKSIDEFVSNDRVFKYAMKAFGLQDMDYAKAFMRKVLAEGIDDPQSFANKLSDPKYREFAETFNFARYTTGATIFERARQGTVDRYTRQTLEMDAGQSNEGVRLALYFQRKAASAETPYHLMADKALLKVTQIALGIPEATATMDIDRQAEMISKKLDIEDLKDPEKLDKFIGRFTALWEIENPTAPAASGLTQLFGGGYDSGIGYDLLTQMQNIRKV